MGEMMRLGLSVVNLERTLGTAGPEGKQPTVLADGQHGQQPMTEAAARGQKWGWRERGSKRRRAGSTGSTAGRMPAATGAGLAGRFELFRFIGP